MTKINSTYCTCNKNGNECMVIPLPIAIRRDICHGAKLTYGYLRACANQYGIGCFDLAEVCKVLSRTDRQCRTYVKQLREINAINVEMHGPTALMKFEILK